jgi:hypothetical protein
MKLCGHCGVEKELSEFNRKNQTRYQSWCRPCMNDISRERYHSDREGNAEKQRILKKARMDAMRKYIRAIKNSTPCLDCNELYPWYVMDFDHVNGKKTTSISEMVQQSAAKWKVLSEITKCELVCSNCHRKRTFSRAGLSTEEELD